MNGIMIPKRATVDELKAVELPQQTDTYIPVPHDFVTSYIENEVAEMLGGSYSLQSNEFGLSMKGDALFGMACFKNSDDYVGLNIAYRNSYNKVFALAVAFGAQVFVCANGMLTGEVIVAKKHTVNVFESFKQIVEDNIDNAHKVYDSMKEDVDYMRNKAVAEIQAYQMLGVARGNDVLSSRVFETALQEYNKPTYEVHKDGSMMEVYNACTEALKKETYPDRAMVKRIELHGLFKDKFFKAVA